MVHADSVGHLEQALFTERFAKSKSILVQCYDKVFAAVVYRMFARYLEYRR